MTAGPLAGLQVLDLSHTIAGQFAARIMADHGAATTLVEPPAGTPTRRMAPLRSDGSSLLFWHLNGGKQSIALDTADPERWNDLIALCRNADIVIGSEATLLRRIADSCPNAVVGIVTDFGANGPYANWRGSELIFQALSGSMHATGLADREPLYGVGHRVSYAAGLWTYIGLLAALVGRLKHGCAYGPVEITLHEAAVAMEENFSLRHAYSGEDMPRGGDPYRAVSTFECTDGWVTLFLRSGGKEWQKICAIVGDEQLGNDPRFANWPLIFRNWRFAREELNARTLKMDVAALVSGCEQADMVAAKVETAASLRDEKHLAARNYWQTVKTPQGDRLNLGPLFRIPAAPAVRDRAPPAIGNICGLDRTAAAAPPASNSGPLPLSGISVLDFTIAWAGPMATKILACLGADVVKMEGPRWYDSWRGLLKPSKPEQYPNGDIGAHPYNRCALFNAQNHNKRSLVLDLKSERARDIVRTIAARVDLLVSNFRPGALARQGLGYDALNAINPRLSVVEMPAVGAGPFDHRIGLGPTMEAMAGITALIGYPGRPMGSGSSYMDPMGGLHGAAAALTALYRQAKHGISSHIEVAQREAAMQWIGEILLDSLENGRQRPLTGNAVETACPHNAFPTEGDGCIAIAVFTDAQFSSLCDVLGCNDWASDVRFSTAAARHAHRGQLEALVADATRSWNKVALSTKLQNAGVPAAPIINGRELFEDAQLRSRGWFTALTHPDAGTHEYASLPPIFGGERCRPKRAAPMFGEHTEAVLQDYAPAFVQELDELRTAGVSSDRPS